MAGGRLFGPEKLVAFELGDAGLVGTDDGGAVGRHDAVEQLFDLALDLGGFALGAGGEVAGLGEAMVPDLAEHGACDRDGAVARLQALQEVHEGAFDHIAADRFAVVGAAFGEAEIVRVLGPGLRGRPAGGQRPTAAGAGDCTSEGKVRVDIGPGRHTRALGDAGLDALILSKRDQALVVALAARNTPVGYLDIAGIMEAGEKPVHLLIADLAARIATGESGLGFEETLDLGLALQSAGGKPLEGVGEDGGDRFVADHDLAMAGAALEAIAWRCVEAPIAVESACAHPVLGLLAVLLALMLADGGQQVLDENAVAILAEGDGRALEPATGLRQRAAERPMAFDIPGEAADIVDDDDDPVGTVAPHEGEHLGERGAFERAARDRLVIEGLDDRVALARGVLAAPGGLAFKPMALFKLRDRGHSTVDDGLQAALSWWRYVGDVLRHSNSFLRSVTGDAISTGDGDVAGLSLRAAR